MNTRRYRRLSLAGLLISAAAGFGFTQSSAGQNRIPQQVVINGQSVNAAYVQVPGGMQSFSCSNPQPYVTRDGAMQGWACYEAATGIWLLNAVPPAQTAAPAPVPQPSPTVIYQQPPTVVYQEPAFVYASPIYPSVYPVVVGRPYYAPYYYGSYYGSYYSPRVVLGAAAINATGRIVSSALIGRRYYSNRAYFPAVRTYAPVRVYNSGRGHRR